LENTKDKKLAIPLVWIEEVFQSIRRYFKHKKTAKYHNFIEKKFNQTSVAHYIKVFCKLFFLARAKPSIKIKNARLKIYRH
jgi:hypothetical protein